MTRFFRGPKKSAASLTEPRDNGPFDPQVCRFLETRHNGWLNQQTGEILEGFPIVAEDTVIDVGCGDGGISVFAAKRGAEVIATDIVPEKVELLKEKLAKSLSRAFRGIVSDSNPLPVADQTATKVIAREVLEHVEDPQQFLSELVRVGKPGALYLITVPDPLAESLQRVVAPPCYWQKPNHLHVFEREQFVELVRQSGLQIERQLHTGFYWSMWWILFWAAEQEFGAPEGPLLQQWTKTWHALITSPKGLPIRKALDQFMPKTQGVIAAKAA